MTLGYFSDWIEEYQEAINILRENKAGLCNLGGKEMRWESWEGVMRGVIIPPIIYEDGNNNNIF